MTAANHDLSKAGTFDPSGMLGWENRGASRHAANEAAQACLSQHFGGAHYAHSWNQSMREAVDAAIDTERRASEERERVLVAALEQYREAMRLTREYVGESLLPALPGWSWYDADEKARALLNPEDAGDKEGEA